MIPFHHKLYQRWLFPNHTESHELYLLELPRAWEPMARAFRYHEGKRSQTHLLDGNQKEECVFGKG